MKVALFLSAILACCLALPKYQGVKQHHDIKQQHVYDILKYINNPLYNKEFLQIVQDFDLKSHAQHYKNEAYETFMEMYEHHDLLKKGEIFSIFNNEHMHQAKALFKLFFYADSYQTFHHTALWARHHLNEGLFLYSYSVAIAHRPDTHNLVLPPVYELFPNYFFNSEVMQQAYQHKMSHYHHGEQQEHYTIHVNYSGSYLNLDPEQSLSYYLEDVGLNAFYFYFQIHYPFWMTSEEFQLNYNRGELFYYTHKQLYARYHLERLSHGLGEVEYFNWDVPFKTGYYPSLTYPNGLSFPERPHFANLKEYLHYYGQKLCDKSQNAFDYTYVQIYEQRIREAIDSGFVQDHEGNRHKLYSEEGINILGNIIEGNADSPNYQYYGSFVKSARHLLGYSKHPLNHHKLAPSALEHLSTSLRDPAFYQIFRKVFTLIDQYKQNLPRYHQRHLLQDGLKIEHVEFDKLITYYDNFYADITNGLFVSPEEYEQDSFRVKVHQYRLNHKNFNYKVHVKAEKATKAAVRVFIGPKYDQHGRPLKLSEIHNKIYQIDYFAHDLKVGDNIITRNSVDCYWFIKDFPSFFETYHKGVGVEESKMQHGLPLRFKLPRGSEAGLSFQVYVMVHPYVHNKHVSQEHEIDGLQVVRYIPQDSFPWGYPFDRPVEHEDVYHVPNAYVKHVKIYHQMNEGIMNGNSYDESIDHDDDEKMYVQHGDHNNYHMYHYQVGHAEEDEHDDAIYHGKNYETATKYQTYGPKGFFHDLMKSYPVIQKHVQVYGPAYKPQYQVSKYHSAETTKYDDDEDKIQYKKKDIYHEDPNSGKYEEHGNSDNEKYQKYAPIDDDQVHHAKQYYARYQKHGDDEKYVDEKMYDTKYQRGKDLGIKYGKYYETKMSPYQAEDHMKYVYGDDYQNTKYQYDSEEHHGPTYHHY